MAIRSTLLATFVGGAVVVTVLSGCGGETDPVSGSAASQPTVSPTQSVAESHPPGDIPDNQAFVVFTAADRQYTVKYPEGWARTDSGSDVLFSDKFNSMTVAPYDGFYQPTESFARSVQLPEIAASTAGFVPGTISTLRRPAGQVILVTYQADSPASPVTGKSIKQDVQRYEFVREGRGVVVTLSAPAGSDNVDPWRIITDSFTWLP
ncbi:hypothetical protein [Mycolicibacterium sphagni]|uniref:Lipoprotein n=1 Tax=Mycolicibacterium sphagni TaxID=1786 RepID=A0ABX2K3R4_9MYCO|nr:hypothetical protein [Mycolicibacterium sphagni]NTY62345.1 hypothetical protein [Mycolicibacterium sphagni]